MGEKHNGPFQPSFNASLKIDFQGPRVTSDGELPGSMVRRTDALAVATGQTEAAGGAKPGG